MTNEQKRQVRDALVRYASEFKTQTLAAESLQGISASTISQVKNNNWELLSERLWHHIARQVGFYCGEWQPADTSAYLLLRILLSDAQHYDMMYGIAMSEGLGKTFTAAHYARENEDVHYLAGNEHYNRKSFLDALIAETKAQKKAGSTMAEMIQLFTDHIARQSEPLIIIDDAHKLKDRVLHLVVLLANNLTGKAGIVLLGNDALRDRIVDGVRLKKPGYDEIYKSIGRRFITLHTLAPLDVKAVCRANGLYDDEIIEHIQATSNNNLHTAVSLIQMHLDTKAAA